MRLRFSFQTFSIGLWVLWTSNTFLVYEWIVLSLGQWGTVGYIIFWWIFIYLGQWPLAQYMWICFYEGHSLASRCSIALYRNQIQIWEKNIFSQKRLIFRGWLDLVQLHKTIFGLRLLSQTGRISICNECCRRKS